MSPESRSQATAAGIILLSAALVIYFLPTIVLWIGNFSPTLAIIVGVCLIMAFFAVFWLRARYQRSRGK
jgi:positive regulator of sigma E activity